MAVSEALLRAFNANIGELSKPALEQFIRCCQRVLHRGHNVGSGGQKQPVPRIVLSGDVLTELLHGAYYCIYNGLQVPGSQVRMALSQVLGDEIGTAMTHKRSRPDQFSLIIHGQEGEGEAQEVFLEKRVSRCV